MKRNPVLVFEVITPYVPLEITGTIDGHSFYYRSRHDRWSIRHHIIDYGIGRPEPIAEGHAQNGDECNIVFALTKIVTTFKEQLDDLLFDDET